MRHHDRQGIIWGAKCDASTKLLLFAISRLAEVNGNYCPSIGALSEMTGLSRDPIIRRINRLVEIGAVIKTPRFEGDGGQKSNHYELDLDLIASYDWGGGK